jgi:hypothetical protein
MKEPMEKPLVKNASRCNGQSNHPMRHFNIITLWDDIIYVLFLFSYSHCLSRAKGMRMWNDRVEKVKCTHATSEKPIDANFSFSAISYFTFEHKTSFRNLITPAYMLYQVKEQNFCHFLPALLADLWRNLLRS